MGDVLVGANQKITIHKSTEEASLQGERGKGGLNMHAASQRTTEKTKAYAIMYRKEFGASLDGRGMVCLEFMAGRQGDTAPATRRLVGAQEVRRGEENIMIQLLSRGSKAKEGRLMVMRQKPGVGRNTIIRS